MITQLLPFTNESIEIALDYLARAGVIAFPTDTVYGIAVSAFDQNGIKRLYDIKERSSTKAIAVLLSSKDQFSSVSDRMPDFARKLADRFWPGPLTLVVPRNNRLPKNISPFPTVGVRMPKHDLLRTLITRSGPLATTSANLSGSTDSITASDVIEQLMGRIELILDGGKTEGGTPSTVVDCTGEKATILREGAIQLVQIQEILGKDHIR